MSEKNSPLIDDDLADELAQTAATLTRLGVTLAGLPIAMLPRNRREQARRVSGELLRIGAVIPRAVGKMLVEVADEWDEEEGGREDLGSRLRREKLEAEAEAEADD